MKMRKVASGADVVTLERDKPVIEIAFDAGAVRVSRGVPPVWVIVHLLLFGTFAAVITPLFFWVSFNIAASCRDGFAWSKPVLAFVFLLFGTFGAWWVEQVSRIVFPYRAELDVRNGVLTIRNALRRSRYPIAGDGALVVEPVHSHGDWGYAICIRSGGRQRDFVPPVFVGPRVRALRRGKETATLIRECVSSFGVEPSKRWPRRG